jgi:hypothetical protein
MASIGPVLPSEAREVLAPFLAPVDAPSSAVAEASDAPSTAAPKAKAKADASDAESLSDLFREGEEKLGKALKDGAAEGVRRAAAGGIDGRTIERR